MLHFFIILATLASQHNVSLTIVPKIFASITCSIFVPFNFRRVTNWYFLVLLSTFGTFGFSEDSKRGLLGEGLGRPRGILGQPWGVVGASLGYPCGVLGASLGRPGLGHPRLG